MRLRLSFSVLRVLLLPGVEVVRGWMNDSWLVTGRGECGWAVKRVWRGDGR